MFKITQLTLLFSFFLNGEETVFGSELLQRGPSLAGSTPFWLGQVVHGTRGPDSDTAVRSPCFPSLACWSGAIPVQVKGCDPYLRYRSHTAHRSVAALLGRSTDRIPARVLRLLLREISRLGGRNLSMEK